MRPTEIEEIFDSVQPEQIGLGSFRQKQELDYNIWEDDDHIKVPIRERLLKIAKEFQDTLIDGVIVKDIVVVGSLASYHWSKYSDIDLHLLVDGNKLAKNQDLVTDYFKAKKTVWNAMHGHLLIYGYPVEIYAQDIHEANGSEGVYSLTKDKWIQKPQTHESSIDKKNVCKKAAEMINKIEDYVERTRKTRSQKKIEALSSEVNAFYKSIIRARRAAIAADGEEATDNIVFKILRRSGHLAMLNDLKTLLYDKANALYD